MTFLPASQSSESLSRSELYSAVPGHAASPSVQNGGQPLQRRTSDWSRISAHISDFISRMFRIQLAELRSKGFFSNWSCICFCSQSCNLLRVCWLVSWFQNHVSALFFPPGSAAKNTTPAHMRRNIHASDRALQCDNARLSQRQIGQDYRTLWDAKEG